MDKLIKTLLMIMMMILPCVTFIWNRSNQGGISFANKLIWSRFTHYGYDTSI